MPAQNQPQLSPASMIAPGHAGSYANTSAAKQPIQTKAGHPTLAQLQLQSHQLRAQIHPQHPQQEALYPMPGTAPSRSQHRNQFPQGPNPPKAVPTAEVQL